MAVQSNNRNFIAMASAAVGFASAAIFAAGGTALGQDIPPRPHPSAYTTSPEAAGIGPVSAPQAPLPIGMVVQRTGGSLLRAESFGKPESGPLTIGTASYYGVPEPKPKLLRKHDLVTIVIRENSQFSSNNSTDLKHSNDLDAMIDSYVTLGIQGGGPALMQHSPSAPIELKTASQREFNNTANLERDDTYTGRITAEVIDVKPNGTLVLQATEEIKSDEEEQKVTLIGTCRVEDITPDNTVLSNQIYNLSLSKQNKGAVKDTGTRDLWTRFLDWIKPF